MSSIFNAADLGSSNSLPNRWLSQRETEQSNEIIGKFLNTPESAKAATPTPEQYTKIATSLASNSKLDLTSVNEGRKEDAHITETNFLNNNDYMSSLIGAITTTDAVTDKQGSYTTL